MQRDPWKKRASLFSGAVPKNVERPKSTWRLLPILWIALKRTCTLLGALFLVSTFIIIWSVSSLVPQVDTSLPKDMVLYIELEGSLDDVSRDSGLTSPFGSPTMTVKHFTDALNRAADDPRVRGVFARYERGQYALAHIEEMREAVLNFRKSGKFAHIYAPSFDGGLGAYYLASAFEDIWLQPMGVVLIPGINSEIPFFQKAIEDIGIEPQFFKRNEYKSAYDSVTRDTMSKAHRENMTQLLNDIYGSITSDIGVSRDLSIDEIQAVIDKGLLLSDDALASGLVDHVAYADDAYDLVQDEMYGEGSSRDVKYVRLGIYVGDMLGGGGLTQSLAPSFGVSKSTSKKKSTKKKPVVALVYVAGAIMDNDGTRAQSPVVALGGGVAAADRIASALYDISEDDSIDAVVLRVNSPGGSPVASETILRAVQKVQEKGKTVTVSMGPVAASGGYWVSASADQIFVSETTITGSIGVLGGKLSLEEMWDSLGVNWAQIQIGQNAGLFSFNQPFSKSEAERMEAMLDNIYSSFVTRVSEGRDLEQDQVERIAGGRVWSGKGAVDVGLADQIGGLDNAIDYAAVQVGEETRDDVRVVIMPKPLTQIERFIKALEGNVSVYEFFVGKDGLFSSFKPYVDASVISSQSPVMVYYPVNLR